MVLKLKYLQKVLGFSKIRWTKFYIILFWVRSTDFVEVVLRLIYLKDQLIKSIDAPANNIIPTERLFGMGGVIEVSYLKWLESY